MSARNAINDQQNSRKLAGVALPSRQRLAAPSARALAAAVKNGEIVGAQAAGLRVLASVRAPVPASFRAALQSEHFPVAAAERALVLSIAPRAYNDPSKDGWEIAFRAARDNKDYKAAQQLLDSRAKSMREFFDGWAESMRRNAKLDKEAAIRSHKRARDEKKIHQVRQKLNAGLVKVGATAEQLIPDSRGGEDVSHDSSGSSVGAPRAKAFRRNGRAARRGEAEASDSFERAAGSGGRSDSHKRVLEPPEGHIGVHTGANKRGNRAYLR